MWEARLLWLQGLGYSKLRFQDRVDKVRLLSEGVATGLEGRGLGGS